MKMINQINFSAFVRALASLENHNYCMSLAVGFRCLIQNQQDSSVGHQCKRRDAGFTTCAAINIEGYPREEVKEEGIGWHPDKMFEEGQLKEAVDNLYRMEQPDIQGMLNVAI